MGSQWDESDDQPLLGGHGAPQQAVKALGFSESQRDEKGMADMPSSIFNLVNTVIGGGVLALPYAFGASGLVLGLFFLVVVLLLSMYSLILLIQASKIAGTGSQSTYRGLAISAFGTKGAIFTDVSLILACFGALCSYFAIIADMIVPLIAYWSGITEELVNRSIILSVAFACLVPLSSMRYLTMYKYTSFLAVVSVLYLTFVVVFRSIQELTDGALWECRQDDCFSFANFTVDFFRTIPIISFAFTCQMNFFSIYNELKNPTEKRMRDVSIISLLICALAYSLIGMFGYLTFFDEVEGNILLNYDLDDPLIIAGRMAVALVIIFSFPLMAHPCVETISSLFFEKYAYSSIRRFLIVLSVCAGAYLIAMFVEDVSLIFGITGATASTMISFILPACFFLAIHPSKSFSLVKLSAIALVVLGLVFMVASTAVTLIDELSPEEITPTPTPTPNATAF